MPVHVCVGVRVMGVDKADTLILQFDELYQEAEPMASTSVLATLQLAARKGFIPHEKRKDSKGSKTSQGDAKKDL